MLRFFCITLCLACTASVAPAQYRGGTGDGQSLVAASLVGLSASSMFAGGSNDGQSALAVNAVSLSALNTPYSGGSNDGGDVAISSGLSLSAASAFSGGADDGVSGVSVAGVALASASMFAGGSNDGAHAANAVALALASASAYSGGPNDGADAATASALSLAAPTMYAGGGNDGFHLISAAAASLSAQGSMYAGGSDDGFSAIFAPALSVALPIRWEDFIALRKGADALLEWTVEGEQPGDRYIIERSYDAARFSAIGSIVADGGQSGRVEHRYTDLAPVRYCSAADCRAAFYRIRLMYAGGLSGLSQVRRVALDAVATVPTVYPNPASDHIIIRLAAVADCRIDLFNATGSLALHSDLYGSATTRIDVRDLPAGLYLLRLSINGDTYPYSIIITH